MPIHFLFLLSGTLKAENNAAFLEESVENMIAGLYPEWNNFAEQYNKMAFRNLDSEILDYLNTLWENLKIN